MNFPVLCESVTWFHVLGYLYAVAVPAYFLARIAQRLWIRIAVAEGVPAEKATAGHRKDLPALLGLLERAMYVAAWVLGHPEFIGIWMGLKVAGGWNAWTHGYAVKGVKSADGEPIIVNGRHIFNTHLIGSALSVLSGVTGGLIIQWLIQGDWSRALWVGIVTLGFTIAVWIWSETSPTNGT